MLRTEKYQITPFINDSFDDTIKEFSQFISSQYDVFDIIYKSKIPINNTTIGYNFSKMSRPKKIYVCVNFMNNGCWKNQGGTLFCTIILMDKTNIDIRWDTSTNVIGRVADYDGDYEDFFNKYRKFKLEKLNKITKM